MAATKQLISTVTVTGSNAASVTFSSIPQTFTDLLVVVSGRHDSAYVGQSLPLGVNGNAQGAVWTQRWLQGDGSVSSGSYGANPNLYPFYLPAANATANTFGNGSIYIANYASTTQYKSVSCDGVVESNASTGVRAEINSMLFSSNTAISSITLYGNSNLVVGTTASLYGITKGSGGATVS